MEIFDLPPMLKGNEQDLPNLRNYLIRLGDEIKRIQNDVSTIESIEQIVKNAEKAIEYTEQAIKTKQNMLTFDSEPTAGSNNPVTSDGINSVVLKMRKATVAADGWTASARTTASGTEYAYYKDITITGMTANDYVDIALYGNAGVYKDNYAVESKANAIRILVASQPAASTTWLIYYKVGMDQTT